jgi:hypothetical protein
MVHVSRIRVHHAHTGCFSSDGRSLEPNEEVKLIVKWTGEQLVHEDGDITPTKIYLSWRSDISEELNLNYNSWEMTKGNVSPNAKDCWTVQGPVICRKTHRSSELAPQQIHRNWRSEHTSFWNNASTQLLKFFFFVFWNYRGFEMYGSLFLLDFN